MFIATIILLFIQASLGHSGGTIKSGPLKEGHKNNKLNGKNWSSKEQEPISKYKRGDWGPWDDQDNNCLNTRQELLKQRSKIPVIIKKCRVKNGIWDDFYFNEELKEASDIDIDHVVPVAHAHKHGGHKWSRKEKQIFYNDGENLVITNKKYNRQKGSKDFTEWLPVQKAYACKYAKQWFYIKEKYKLKISEKESNYYKILKCDL